jgi:hypothetical protein
MEPLGLLEYSWCSIDTNKGGRRGRTEEQEFFVDV